MRADTAVPFSLTVPEGLDLRGDYIISAHADVDRSGDISVGDYLTTESFPVAVDGSQGAVEVRLRPVR